MSENENRPLRAGGQDDGAGRTSINPKIVQFRRPVKPPPALIPAPFDVALSRRIDLVVYLIEHLQAVKGHLETRIPESELAS